MPNYGPKDIAVLDAVESIRLRAWMYVGAKENLLPKIISSFLENLVFLGVSDFHYKELNDLVVIKSNTDWMKNSGIHTICLNDVFKCIVPVLPPEPSKEGMNRFRAEVLLTAFYFDYFTFGETGEYGNKALALGNSMTKQLFKEAGRFIVISKNQELPSGHNINHERPDRTLSEIENEIYWLSIMKEQKEKQSE